MLIMVISLDVQVVISFADGKQETLKEEPFKFQISWEKGKVPAEKGVEVVVHFIGHYKEPPLERTILITREQSGWC